MALYALMHFLERNDITYCVDLLLRLDSPYMASNFWVALVACVAPTMMWTAWAFVPLGHPATICLNCSATGIRMAIVIAAPISWQFVCFVE